MSSGGQASPQPGRGNPSAAHRDGTAEPAKSPRPQVGRGPKVRAAILAAALAELADNGYAALNIENIARRAGVHKTTVYRRWKDRESLVADVLGERIAMDFPIPDTGSADSDLRQLARAFVNWVTGPTGRMIFAAVYSEAARIPGISEVRRELLEYGPRRAAVVIERAIGRGELPVGTDAAATLKAMVAPIYFRLTVTGEPVNPAAADQAAATALAAAPAGIFTPAPATAPATRTAPPETPPEPNRRGMTDGTRQDARRGMRRRPTAP